MSLPCLCLLAFSPVSRKRRNLMPHELQGAALIVAVLAALATLLKHERRLKRWLTRSPGRKRPATLRRPAFY